MSRKGKNMTETQESKAPEALPFINVNAQYVKDLSFENPQAPKSLAPAEKAPVISVNLDVQAKALGKDLYEVELMVRAEAKRDEAVLFIVDLRYAGLFTLHNIPESSHSEVLLIEGPRMLFPFARAIVADATREGGFPPLMINPIDFAALFRMKLAEQAKAAETMAKN